MGSGTISKAKKGIQRLVAAGLLHWERNCISTDTLRAEAELADSNDYLDALALIINNKRKIPVPRRILRHIIKARTIGLQQWCKSGLDVPDFTGGLSVLAVVLPNVLPIRQEDFIDGDVNGYPRVGTRWPTWWKLLLTDQPFLDDQLIPVSAFICIVSSKVEITSVESYNGLAGGFV